MGDCGAVRNTGKDRLAREILKMSRDTLLVNLRFLDMALSQLAYVPAEIGTLAVDGTNIFYQAGYILRTYREAREAPVRDYLHMVLHCVFRHMYVAPTVDYGCWDLACDIAVEHMINELGIKGADAPRAKRQTVYIDDMKRNVKRMTAEQIYARLRDEGWTEERISAAQAVFRGDDHSIWYMSRKEKMASLGLADRSGAGKSAAEGGSGGSAEEEKRGAFGGMYADGSFAEDIWKKIAARMQVDLETFGKQQGNIPGAMLQNLSELNRERYDYTAFLKKFAVLGEAMRINDDEYDYIFYTYGLKRYGNMPLIEPLEYKEVKRIREFVIAIDTSGSTSGELVQKFVQKTYNILKSTESFFTKINLHIIQCDAQIQEDAKITSQEEFDAYLREMKIRGLGGTDFRPVFQYVEQLRRAKEFRNLRGLIYFTDGYGIFPERKPDYDTAFVFLREDYENPDVPAWAIRLVLEKDEI